MSQFLGTFSGGIFQITTNGVEFIIDKPDGFVEDRGFLSENQFEKISDILIKECNDKYGQTDIPHLILDLSDNFKMYQVKGDIVESRQIKINSVLDTKFEVVSWYELLEMPSRQTLYDSVTKNTNLFERHKKVLEFLNSLEFNIVDLLESELTQQELLYNSYEREISYKSDYSPRIIIRVKPNLMIEMIISPDKNDSVEINKRYFFFYNPTQIINIVSENSPIQTKRDLKLKTLSI